MPYINTDKAWDSSALTNWYIHSVDNSPPIWTSDHINELCNDFYVIPKEAPVAEAIPVIHAHWTQEYACGGGFWDFYFICSRCSHNTPVRGYSIAPDFCPGCGAKMDERMDEYEQRTDYAKSL